MAIVRTGESEYDKELAKWDAPRRLGGMRPDGFEEFPQMLYRARVKDNGQAAVSDPQDENFARSCQMIVRNGDERDRALKGGWSVGPVEALAAHEAAQKAIADAAAEANYAAQRMSEKAQAERKKRDAATDKHLPE